MMALMDDPLIFLINGLKIWVLEGKYRTLARAAELVSMAPGEVHGGATQALVLCCCHLERRRCWTRERKKKEKKWVRNTTSGPGV